MEEVYMIPKAEMEELIQHWKGELTENAQLTKAAKLAAKKQVLSKSGLPPALVNAKIKPMGRELTKLTKRIRQGPQVGPGAPPEEEDLVTGPVDQWVKKIIKALLPPQNLPFHPKGPNQEDFYQRDLILPTLNPKNENGKPK